MTEKERMLSGKLYCPFKVGDNTWEKSREVLEKFNSMPWHQEKERMQLLREIFGHLEEDAVIVPPLSFWVATERWWAWLAACSPCLRLKQSARY